VPVYLCVIVRRNVLVDRLQDDVTTNTFKFPFNPKSASFPSPFVNVTGLQARKSKKRRSKKQTRGKKQRRSEGRESEEKRSGKKRTATVKQGDSQAYLDES
jgi:hypothetical protein